jgi:hypothetical protein
MTPDAILLRPVGTALGRRIAAALATGFMLVLVLARLALPTPTGSLASDTAPAGNPVAMPRGMLWLSLPADTGFHADALLDSSQLSLLNEWGAFLRQHPRDRMVLTVSAPDSVTSLQVWRIGAALIRALARQPIDPHRLRLLLQATGDEHASAHGPIQVSLEAAHP